MVHYFAYGSNMNQEDFKRRCASKSHINLTAKKPIPCTLNNYLLTFNYYSTTRNGGAANIEKAGGGRVEGVLYDISEKDLHAIDAKEGYYGPNNQRNFYDRIEVSVMPAGSTKPVTAVTYIANQKMVKTSFQPPTKDYLQVIIKGAKDRNLPTTWLRKLEAIQTKGNR
jgi:gamma-glutamylcyclotransferase (GGCT)/AIG2-like uncharacterized protein YtfP